MKNINMKIYWSMKNINVDIKIIGQGHHWQIEGISKALAWKFP